MKIIGLIFLFIVGFGLFMDASDRYTDKLFGKILFWIEIILGLFLMTLGIWI